MFLYKQRSSPLPFHQWASKLAHFVDFSRRILQNQLEPQVTLFAYTHTYICSHKHNCLHLEYIYTCLYVCMCEYVPLLLLTIHLVFFYFCTFFAVVNFDQWFCLICFCASSSYHCLRRCLRYSPYFILLCSFVERICALIHSFQNSNGPRNGLRSFLHILRRGA